MRDRASVPGRDLKYLAKSGVLAILTPPRILISHRWAGYYRGRRAHRPHSSKEASMLLENKVAAITGAASGIGREIALAYAAEGAQIVVLDVDSQRGEAVVEELRGASGRDPFYVPIDVRSGESVDEAFGTIAERAGGVDIAVNSAGVREIAHPLELDRAEWDNVLAINLTGTFYCCQAAGRQMVARGGGAIVNISSTAGLMAYENRPAYTASKFGVIGITKSLARDLGPLRIRVNAICPGLMRTPFTEFYFTDEEFVQNIPRVVPLGTYGLPTYIAQGALFLASDMAQYVTGVVLPIDGGHTIATTFNLSTKKDSPFSGSYSPSTS